MRRFLPEIIGTVVLLALAAAGLYLLYIADSAVQVILAILCLIGMKIDIWVYRKVVRRQSVGTDVVKDGLGIADLLDQ
jgi:membrane protein YdbS with pleckstrin-like domain